MWFTQNRLNKKNLFSFKKKMLLHNKKKCNKGYFKEYKLFKMRFGLNFTNLELQASYLSANLIPLISFDRCKNSDA